MEEKKNIFKNGSVWVKADFHLHTKADKEFIYDGKDNDFVLTYMRQLKQNGIGVGLIANHNKFDLDEYKALRRSSLKENIYLIPGVELSVADGSNGVHALIAFEFETWIKNNDNFIEQFLSSAFEGTVNRENSNTRCKYNLSDLFKKLEEHRKEGRDSFIVMAHAEQDCGFCKELDGGRIIPIVGDNLFKKNVLGFQKMRTIDLINNLKTWFRREEFLPAFLEGSDCKNINEIGHCGTQVDEKGNSIEKASFIKIGDFSFDAIKYALTDKANRISNDRKPTFDNAYIKSISFEGGLLDTQEISFSPELNNLIGIRGSGKSSIIEILRYTLGISLGNQASDREYKNGLIEYVLKSGAKVVVAIVNEHKKEYLIEKIYGQREDVYENGTRKEITIDAIFRKPVYFGQKDLSNKDIDFEADLVKKLVGNRLDEIQTRITRKIYEIEDIISTFKKLENLEELKKETNGKIKDAEEKLKIFKEKGVKDKLRQQSNFDTDISTIEEIGKGLEEFNSDIKLLIVNNEIFFKNTVFKSEENVEIFNEAENLFKTIKTEFEKLSEIEKNAANLIINFTGFIKKLKEKKDGLKEEFAKTKRNIAIPNLNPDDFLKLSRQIEVSKLKLIEIEKSEKKRNEHLDSLNNKISELNYLWHEEYKILEKEVQRINEYKSSLSISVKYKGRTDSFIEKMKQTFKGSGIRETAYQNIQTDYKDFIEIYRDKDKLNNILNNNQLAEFNRLFAENLFELLTFRVDNKFTIKYNNKPLKDHSLGQRATALILFLLAQKETDILIIDQPEDDLDNQTIYEDVIKEIKSLKGKMQFIFATHNANIPVLGDSEKIVSCKYTESKIDVHGGTIDNHATQKQIVSIMEGGEEAFNRRKNIYELWSLKR